MGIRLIGASMKREATVGFLGEPQLSEGWSRKNHKGAVRARNNLDPEKTIYFGRKRSFLLTGRSR